MVTYLQTCQALIQENLETNEKKKIYIYIYIYIEILQEVVRSYFFFIGSKLNKPFFLWVY